MTPLHRTAVLGRLHHTAVLGRLLQEHTLTIGQIQQPQHLHTWHGMDTLWYRHTAYCLLIFIVDTLIY